MNPFTMIELQQAQYRGFDRCYRLMNWVRSRAHYDALALLLYVLHDKTVGGDATNLASSCSLMLDDAIFEQR